MQSHICFCLKGTVIAEPGLDFEVLGGSISFVVLVRDQPADALTQRSTTCQVMVTLRDVNDNVPVFDESLYEASVVENRPIGTTITTVTAMDRDFGRNGQVIYNIQSTAGNEVPHITFFKKHA